MRQNAFSGCYSNMPYLTGARQRINNGGGHITRPASPPAHLKTRKIVHFFDMDKTLPLAVLAPDKGSPKAVFTGPDLAAVR